MAVAVVGAVSAIVAAGLAAWATIMSARINATLRKPNGDGGSVGEYLHRIDVRTAVTDAEVKHVREDVKELVDWRDAHEQRTSEALQRIARLERRP